MPGPSRCCGLPCRAPGVCSPNPVIIYWSEEDQTFIAEVPELPGCAADGKTHKDALSNVEVAIQEWIETARELGRPIRVDSCLPRCVPSFWLLASDSRLSLLTCHSALVTCHRS